MLATIGPRYSGKKAFSNVGALPEEVDLAIIATPAKTVCGLVDQCGRAGVKAVDHPLGRVQGNRTAGKALEEELLAVARQYGIRLVGPNSLGVIRPATHLNGTFLSKFPKPGHGGLPLPERSAGFRDPRRRDP